MTLTLPGVPDPQDAENVWSTLRDIAAVCSFITMVAMPVVVWIINAFHQANIRRFEHLDKCIDQIKKDDLASARVGVTRDELDATLGRMQQGLNERMASNMTTATQLMSQRETTLSLSFGDIRDRLRALEAGGRK